jgi:L-amino acid N-acyltransferase YncA
MTMNVRPATPDDAEAMAAILNAVIAIGGTTAHQHPKSVEAVLWGYITKPEMRSSVVAEADGNVIGWQSVEFWRDALHIGTFVAPGVQARGAGAAMFALTRNLLRPLGPGHIIATIRADNVPGLAYYARLGFRDIGHDPHWALEDGRVVGRIDRRFDL